MRPEELQGHIGVRISSNLIWSVGWMIVLVVSIARQNPIFSAVGGFCLAHSAGRAISYYRFYKVIRYIGDDENE